MHVRFGPFPVIKRTPVLRRSSNVGLAALQVTFQMIRTLVVDDSDIIRKSIRTILEFRGDIEVCAEATNGREAITKVLEYQPDLVILDLTMPLMDGFTAAAELRKRLPQLPILLCSIHESPQVVKQAKQVGARGYVSKEDLIQLPEAVDAVVIQKTTYFLALQLDDQ